MSEVITTPDGYRFLVQGQPDYSQAVVLIPAGQMLKVEASAMAGMDANLKMRTKLKGGFARILTGESLFLNEFTAEGMAGEIAISPGPLGAIEHRCLNNETIFLQSSSFLACSPTLKIETKWQGLTKGFFSGMGMFLVKVSGSGSLWFNSYGAMIPVDVNGEYLVDTSHIVGFTQDLQYQVRAFGGYKSLFFSGEGLVCLFQGQGRVWIQTRKLGQLTSWLQRFRPVKRNAD